MKPSPPERAANPAVVELQSLRLELKQIREEVAGVRADFRKLNIIDQVAKGVFLGGAVLWAVVFVLNTVVRFMFEMITRLLFGW